MLLAVLAIGTLALVAGTGLALAARKLPAADSSLVEEINALLPQTQCAQCGYAGCRPYAEAIVDRGEAINLCPPGGEATVQKLARRLGRDPAPLKDLRPPPAVAFIDEDRCIGCLHCRNACPVDAIVGAQNTLHTVIEAECTGCELCIAPCPVDCIELKAAS